MEQAEYRKQNANVRVLFLMCFFASSIGDVFNTVFIRQMLFDAGVDKEFYISLPITAMSATMVISVLVSGQIVGRTKSFNSYLRYGIATLFVGLLLRGLAFDYYILVAGFAISGFGTGLLYIGIRYYAFMFQEEERRNDTMVHIIGGSFIGQCLGTVLGGILSGQINNRYIYLFSAVLLIVPFVIVNHIRIEGRISVVKYSELLGILKNRRALIYLLFVVLPMYACSVYLSYTVPLDVCDYGLSSTVTSTLIFVNYLISAYAGLFLIPRLTARMSGERCVLIYLLLTACMINLYVVFPSLWMLIAVVLVCGVLDSFGLTIAISTFATPRYKGKYPDNGTLIFFILFSRIGQMIGPTMISLTGNLAAIGVFLVLGASIFFITNGVKGK